MKTAFLYAGQGSQHVGMGQDFYKEYEMYQTIVDELTCNNSYKTLMHDGPMEELTKTENTQGCMAVFAAGVTSLLKADGIFPDAVCGLSLGEYGALYCAEVFDAGTYVDLVSYRGKVMAEAAKGLSCSMSAVLGMSSELVAGLCQEYSGEGFVTATNFNCPGQVVICGDEEAVTGMEEILKEHGAKRCLRLKVSGPFHTKYMKPAAEALAKYMKDIDFHNAKLPILTNVTGEYVSKEMDWKTILEKQVQSPVLFEKELVRLMEDGFTRFIEIGPGNALAGFLKKTAKELNKEIQIFSIDTVEDYRKVVEHE